jgi:hypothetical protein
LAVEIIPPRSTFKTRIETEDLCISGNSQGGSTTSQLPPLPRLPRRSTVKATECLIDVHLAMKIRDAARALGLRPGPGGDLGFRCCERGSGKHWISRSRPMAALRARSVFGSRSVRKLRRHPVGSGTGAVIRRQLLGCSRGFPLRARVGAAVIPSPGPATSHAACGFPALRAPAPVRAEGYETVQSEAAAARPVIGDPVLLEQSEGPIQPRAAPPLPPEAVTLAGPRRVAPNLLRYPVSDVREATADVE